MSGNKKEKIAFLILIILDGLFLFWIVRMLSQAHLTFALLSPAGQIAQKEKNLIITAVLLMLIVVVPVLSAAVYIARKYRADNPHHSDYQPDWQDSKKLQFLWWAFPGTIIICLCVLTWKSSHALDPYRPISSSASPITVEVVALEWKWLFIYPQQKIATINYLEIPQGTPVHFILTADAPMNSFWIPQLGGQIYAMAGMATQLHLIADKQGEFDGSAAEINGKGFAGMRFKVESVSQADFNDWAASVRNSSAKLSSLNYDQLAQPSTYDSKQLYSLADANLFNSVLDKYMPPVQSPSDNPGEMDMSGMFMNFGSN